MTAEDEMVMPRSDSVRKTCRPKPQTYESRGEWGSWSVREGRKGWIVEGVSRERGHLTNWRRLLPYEVKPEGLSRGEPLDRMLSDRGVTVAELIIHAALSHDACRILRKGFIVP